MLIINDNLPNKDGSSVKYLLFTTQFNSESSLLPMYLGDSLFN
jgi:hypothetical protein